MTVEDHIKHLQRHHKPKDIIAVQMWVREDVKHLDKTLTDEDCDDVLDSVHTKQDASLGITWDTLEFYINTVADRP